MTENEILRYAVEHGMIDVTTICNDIDMARRKEILEENNCKIWEDKKGFCYAYLPDEKFKYGRKLVKRKNRNDLEKLLFDFYKSQKEKHLFYESMIAWGQRKLEYGEIMKQTYDRYVYDYERYIKGTSLDKKDLSELTQEYLEDYCKRLIHDHEMTIKRWNNLKGVLIGTLKYAKKQGYTEFSILDFFNETDFSKRAFKKKLWVDDEQVFDYNEIRLVEEYINSKPECIVNLAILFTFQTGLRVGELSTLKFDDLNGNVLNVSRTEERFKDESGHYKREVRESTKGKDGCRKVILTQKALDLITRARKLNLDGEYIFMNQGERLIGNTISIRLYRMCKQLGFTPKSIHKVRKTYATNLLNAGVDEKVIEKQLGHKSISTTKNYYYFNDKSIDEMQEQITNAISW